MKLSPHAGVLAAVFVSLGCVSFSSAQSGLLVSDLSSGLTAEDLAQTLVGTGVQISNVTYRGTALSAGSFSGGAATLGINNGVVLSTGSVRDVRGPLNQATWTSTASGLPGDPDLDAWLIRNPSMDACVLEFDFECEALQSISFEIVFASEEYNEWTTEQENDLVAIVLNGVQIGHVPGTQDPLGVSSVHCSWPYNPNAGRNCHLFRNNDCADLPGGSFPCTGNFATEMDGLTTVLTISSSLQAGTNHLKFAIGDVGDAFVDSALFIQAQSLACRGPCTSTFQAYGAGCAGTGGIVPILSSLAGCARPNDTFTFDLTQAPGGTPGALLISALGRTQLPLFGCDLLIAPPFIIAKEFITTGPTGVPGVGTDQSTLAIPNDPNLFGLLIQVQSVVFDTGGPASFIFTNGLEIRFAPM